LTLATSRHFVNSAALSLDTIWKDIASRLPSSLVHQRRQPAEDKVIVIVVESYEKKKMSEAGQYKCTQKKPNRIKQMSRELEWTRNVSDA
jgi:hypothetical protein